MKNIQNNKNREGSPSDRSIRKTYDDFNILDPDPDNDFQSLEDENDEFIDYSLMQLEQDQDFYL